MNARTVEEVKNDRSSKLIIKTNMSNYHNLHSVTFTNDIWMEKSHFLFRRIIDKVMLFCYKYFLQTKTGFGVSSGVLDLGSGDFGSVSDWDWKWSNVDWTTNGGTNKSWSSIDGGSSSVNGGGSSWSDGQVGGSDTESVGGISGVGDLLDESVGINVRISTTGHSINRAGFGLGRWATGVSVRILSKDILGMVR